MSSNYHYRCGQCGTEFTASYQPIKNPRCILCRQDPGHKKLRELKIKRSRVYVPVGLKVRIKNG